MKTTRRSTKSSADSRACAILRSGIDMQRKAVLAAEIADRPRIREEIAGMEARLAEIQAR